MELKEQVWMALAALSVLLTIAAGYWPHFPGDVAVARLAQSIAPASIGWAKWISSTAKSPWDLVLLAVTVGISWKLAGWRAALLALTSFAGMWVMGKWLGPLTARPRPSPDLVHVAQNISGYSFPSVFALTYASTIGFLAILFIRKGSGALQTGVVVACCALLLIGGAGRIVLGAHWPSDVGLSYLIGLLWACLLVRFV